MSTFGRRVTALLLVAASLVLLAEPARAWSPQELWDEWQTGRFVSVPAHCIHSSLIVSEIERLKARHGGRLGVQVAGHSYAGEPIGLLTLGNGDRKVFLWSQMHGDEPSATPALLDVADFLLARTEGAEPDAAAAKILDELTLLILPMLNPDGSDVHRRRNAQGIDINRDARNLATPEGRLLAVLREEHEPVLGFNLHDQGRRILVGGSGVLATCSVLAVAGDAAGTVTPGRERSRRAASAVASALEPLFPGGTSRYDEDFNPRAFGDNLTAWGTPVLLIESGGLEPGRPATDLTAMNFVAILRVLEDLARDDLAGHSAAVYDELERNRRGGYADFVLRGGSILPPDGTEYRADLAFDDDFTRRWGECSTFPLRTLRRSSAGSGSRIVEIGDTGGLAAGKILDAADRWIVEPFTVWITGWPLPEWVGQESLARLARLGVAELRWQVAEEHVIEARRIARRHRCRPCARLAVELDQESGRGPLLAAEPGAPRSQSLEHVLEALLGERWHEIEPLTGDPGRADWGEHQLTLLRPLWGGLSGGFWPRTEPLERGGPASFLLISPSGEAPLRSELPAAELTAVWLDGEPVPLSAEPVSPGGEAAVEDAP